MRQRWLVVTVAGGLAGCLTTQTIDPSQQVVAAVSGQVVKPDGVTPVSGPLVAIQLITPPVGGTSQLIAQSAVTADESGRFLFLFVLNGLQPLDALANLTVAAPIGSGFLNADTSNVVVKVLRGQVPTDTTYIQFKLKAR